MDKLPEDIITYCIKPFLTNPECIMLDIELIPLFREITQYEINNSLLDIEQDLSDQLNSINRKWDKWDEFQNDDIILFDINDKEYDDIILFDINDKEYEDEY